MVCMREGEDTEELKVITDPLPQRDKGSSWMHINSPLTRRGDPQTESNHPLYEASTSCGSRIRAFTECTAIPEGWGRTETQVGQQRGIAIDPKCGNCVVNSTMAWKTGDWPLKHREIFTVLPILRSQALMKKKSKSCPENSQTWGWVKPH